METACRLNLSKNHICFGFLIAELSSLLGRNSCYASTVFVRHVSRLHLLNHYIAYPFGVTYKLAIRAVQLENLEVLVISDIREIY